MANRYAKALIHLDPTEALPVIERYEQQFRRASSMKRLRGQAMWQLGDMEAALSCFREALEQEENNYNLLALAHFHLEQGELEQASQYIERALQKVRFPYLRAICLLSQAVVQWLMGEAQVGVETLWQAQRRNRHVTRSKDLQYDLFWREQAIGAVEAMLEEVGQA
jgi:tetratricopeptide (TPR) repeat protein